MVTPLMGEASSEPVCTSSTGFPDAPHNELDRFLLCTTGDLPPASILGQTEERLHGPSRALGSRRPHAFMCEVLGDATGQHGYFGVSVISGLLCDHESDRRDAALIRSKPGRRSVLH